MYALSNVARHHFAAADDVYVLDLHRTSAGLAAITSDQQLALLDAAQLGAAAASASWRVEHGNVTTLSVFDGAGGLVCTAGEDGSVGLWDLRSRGPHARVAQFQGE